VLECLAPGLALTGVTSPGNYQMTDIVIRPATFADVDALVPLVYSSGPFAFDYVFSPRQPGGTKKFLQFALSGDDGAFSHRQHHVAVKDDAVVGSVMLHGGADNNRLAMGNVKTILRCHGALVSVPLMMRGLRMESMLKPPPLDCVYLGHLAVTQSQRSSGIGAKLLAYANSWAAAAGYTKIVLDVAVTNPRAEALYVREGYKHVELRMFNHRKPDMPAVPDHYRMVCFIDDAVERMRAIS